MEETDSAAVLDTVPDVPPRAARPDGVTRATGVRRLASGVVDGLLLSGGLVVVIGLGASSAGWLDWGIAAWTLGFAPLYFALYHAFDKGATPGQLELRIGLVDPDTGAPPGVRRALARSVLGLLFLVLVVPAFVDLMMLLTNGRSVRDRITRTVPVHLRLPGALPELRRPTVAELLPLFEPPAATRRYLRRGWALVRLRKRALLGTAGAVFSLLLAIAVVLAFLAVADTPGDPYAWAAYAVIVAALFGSGVYWTQAALVLAVEQVRTGAARHQVGQTLRRASRRLNALSAALALLLVSATPALYLSALILPLVLASRLTLVMPALVLEDRRVLGSFGRSWELTRGATWRVFGLVLLSGLVLVGLGAAQVVTIGLLATVADGSSAAGTVVLLVLIAAVVAVPFVCALAWLGAAWALVYEDARRLRPPREES